MPKARRAGESDICERGETSFCYQLREPSHSLSQSLRRADEAVVAAWVAETGSARLWPVVVLCEPRLLYILVVQVRCALFYTLCLVRPTVSQQYNGRSTKINCTRNWDVLYHFYNLVPDLLKSVNRLRLGIVRKKLGSTHLPFKRPPPPAITPNLIIRLFC